VRAEISYKAGFVPPADVEEATVAVTQLVRHAEDYVAQLLPE
jgi:hypothetical protein